MPWKGLERAGLLALFEARPKGLLGLPLNGLDLSSAVLFRICVIGDGTVDGVVLAAVKFA